MEANMSSSSLSGKDIKLGKSKLGTGVTGFPWLIDIFPIASVARTKLMILWRNQQNVSDTDHFGMQLQLPGTLDILIFNER